MSTMRRRMRGGTSQARGRWYPATSIDSQDTLAFAMASGVRSMDEFFLLERTAEAYQHMESGKARFRVVLRTGN
jgi:D-arabinose 1-dehydrogenase-like Zn-dependent alcohol dehydrogenase